jgi:RHS repeat-associated protein
MMKPLLGIRCVAGLWLLSLLWSLPAAADNYCNNPVPPCDTGVHGSPCYKPPEPPPKCEPRECDKCTKSPCYAASGVYVADAADLQIVTAGFPIVVSRHYQSVHNIDGESGYGWTSSLSTHLYYTTYLKAAPSTYQKEADIRMPDGAFYRFVDNGNGTFTPPLGRFDQLVQNADGTFDMTLQRSRSVYHFDSNGKLSTMVDDFGNTLAYTYSRDRLQHVADVSGSGRSIDVTYGADGRISDVVDSTGRTVHYVYNTSGVLTGVTDPASRVTGYGYTPGKYVPLLSSVTDPWGRNVSTIVYDAQDRVRSYTDGGETYTYTYAYNGNAGITAKTDSSGNLWQFPFNGDGLVTDVMPPGAAPASHDTYTASGLVQLHTDEVGVKSFYTYNALGNPVTVTLDYQGPSAVEWRLTYEATYPQHVATAVPYNPSNGLVHPDWQGVRFDYWEVGSAAPGALKTIYKLDNDGITSHVAQSFTYDSHGRLLTVTNPAGAVTTNAYDAAGNLVTADRSANNDAGTHPVKHYAYDALGRLTAETDADGHTVSYTYDAVDRVKTATLPKPTPSSPLNFVTTYFYDEFDVASQLLFTRVVDANGRATRVGNDAFGHALQIIDEAGNMARNVYTKGLLASMTDANGYSTSYAWDALRRLSTVTHADGTFERYTYYGDGNVATKRDRANQTITFTYDHLRRVTVKSYPNSSSVTSTYAGQKLTQVVDTSVSPSETHAFTWDASFRLLTNTQATRGTMSFTYAADDLPLTMSVSGGATATYGYYPDRSLRTIDWSPVSGSFKFDYTLAGRRQAITFPNAQTRTYTYDDQGRTVQVSSVHPTTGTIAAFTYGYDIDPATGLATLLGVRASVTANVPALSLSNATTTFAYDARYKLTQASYPAGAPYNGKVASWTYDAAGMRTSETVNGVTANYAYNKYGSNPLNGPELQSDGANAYTYDAVGQMTARSGTRGNFTFTYDYDGRLRTVAGDSAASYGYDYSGRRATKNVGGASTSYLFYGDDIAAESGATSAQYLTAPGLDQPLATARGGQVYYDSVDGVDSVVTLNDATGVVQNSYAWDAWGNAVAQTAGIVNPLGYTAREIAEAGLHSYRFRYYDSATGRFTREDPLQEWVPTVGADLYGYVHSSPVMYSDPYGLACHPVTFHGPWTHTDRPDGWSEITELVDEIYLPYIVRIPGTRIPIFGGGQYFCYWNKYFVVTYYMQRTTTITYFCTCPLYVQSFNSTEFRQFEKRWRTSIQTHSVNHPCSLTPP